MLLFNFSTTLCNWWTCWNHFTIVTQGSELSCRILMIFALRPGFVFCFFTFRSNLPHFRFFSALWSHSFPFSLKFRVVIISRQVESNPWRHCSIETGALIVQWCVCGGLWSSIALGTNCLTPQIHFGSGFSICSSKLTKVLNSRFQLIVRAEAHQSDLYSFGCHSSRFRTEKDNSEIILRPETARQRALVEAIFKAKLE